MSLFPLTLYGSGISYFTGKFEVYCRLKGFDYQVKGLQYPHQYEHFAKQLGVGQMPIVETADGRLMTDSTAMIAWFEEAFPDPVLMDQDPVMRFWSLLLEDYADEWLWRPAMHFRWHSAEGAYLQSRVLANECAKHMPVPDFLKRLNIRRRQRSGYTRGDGITAAAVEGVEAIYHDLLALLEGVFRQRPWMMGERPGLADVAFAGPFFRHFATDPVPLAIMRRDAPAVHEWVARLWNAGPEALAAPAAEHLPEDLWPLLERVGREHLAYLDANVRAVAVGAKRFDAVINGVEYLGARTSKYRVWCLSVLRRAFEALPEARQPEVRALLEQTGCWNPMWAASEDLVSGYDESDLPFSGRHKMIAANE